MPPFSTATATTRPTPFAQVDLRISAALADLEQARVSRDSSRIRRAEDAVVTAHLPAAKRIARRYAGRGAEQDDLEQQARVGLVQAVRRWRPEEADDHLASASNFARFAVPTMEGTVKRWFRDHLTVLRRPRSASDAAPVIRRARDDWEQQNGHPATDAQIAEITGVSMAVIQEAKAVNGICNPVSLDRQLSAGSDGQSTVDAVPGYEDEGFDRVLMRGELSRAWGQLTEREQRVVVLHYWEDRSQASIGAEIGVSQMQISRILTRATGKLRTWFADHDLTAAA
jgi:RNA polymerase sigma-B factor